MSRITRFCLVLALAAGGLWGLGLVAQDKPKAAQPARQARPAQAQPAANDPHAAIGATADEFVRAYNAHDAKALAALFLPEALVFNEDSKSIEGRDSIEETFKAIFEGSPKIQIQLGISSVDLIGKTMAVEVGLSETTREPGFAPERSKYVVLHVEREGQWKMALIRDMPDEPSPHEHLLSLAWLVGEWIDESREGKVATSCRWDESQNFLLQDITVQRAGEATMKVSQRIGWDPLSKRIKAWMFDSEGGHGESVWTPTEAGWLIKFTAVRADGAVASATNVLQPDGYDAYGWRSTDRVVGNEVDPDVEVRVVRRPAPPTVQN